MSELTTVEINGIKLDVDLRTARRIETLKVGMPVRVLVKSYGETFNVYSGVVAGFEPFKELPTITVAYIKTGYSDADIVFAHLNAKSKDIEVVAAEVHELVDFDFSDATKAMDRAIEKAEHAVKELVAKRQYFIDQIGVAWGKVSLPEVSI